MTDKPQTIEADMVRGHSIALDSGAKVALFRDVRPGAHGLRFDAVGGEATWLVLSSEALDALTTLWINPSGEKWRVVA